MCAHCVISASATICISLARNVHKCVNINVTRFAVATTSQSNNYNNNNPCTLPCHVAAFACQRQSRARDSKRAKEREREMGRERDEEGAHFAAVGHGVPQRFLAGNATVTLAECQGNCQLTSWLFASASAIFQPPCLPPSLSLISSLSHHLLFSNIQNLFCQFQCKINYNYSSPSLSPPLILPPYPSLSLTPSLSLYFSLTLHSLKF